MAFIARNGKIRKVKNLGWLLRNWKGVEKITLIAYHDDRGVMSVNLKDCYYEINWASISQAYKWINRHVFRGLPMSWVANSVSYHAKVGDGALDKIVTKTVRREI